MENTMSIVEIKTALSECLRQVETGEPIIITRYGKPVAALVSAHDIVHLKRLRKAWPEKGLASIAGGWNGSEELVKAIKRSPRSGNRDAPGGVAGTARRETEKELGRSIVTGDNLLSPVKRNLLKTIK